MFPKRSRITEIPIDEEDIIERNKSLFHIPGEKYETVNPYRRVMWEITNSETKRSLKQILTEFPYNQNVENQCGYWMRSISGVHPFPDANHRTSTATLLYVLNQNGYAIENITDRGIMRAIRLSKELKKEPGAITVTTENLHEEDALFKLWRDYFEFELWKEYFERKK